MKIVGTIKEIVSRIMELDLSKTYQVEIKEPKSKRSLEQNKLLWELINLIAKETKQDDMTVYCAMLEKANALSDYIITATEMEDALRKTFRGVKFVRKQDVNGKECNIYKVYLGSSKMSVKEMSELLEITVQTCNKYGIYMEEYYEFI